MKNFDLEKNGAEFISRNENSKKVLGNPSNKKNYTCNVTFYCMVHGGGGCVSCRHTKILDRAPALLNFEGNIRRSKPKTLTDDW